MSGSTVVDTLLGYDVSNEKRVHRGDNEHDVRAFSGSNSTQFGQEQIRSLVHQVFFSGGLESPRQVVFSGVDQNARIGEICLRVGHALCAQTSGTVCIVEVGSDLSQVELLAHLRGPSHGDQRFDFLRDSALLLSKKLWLVPSDIFLRNEKGLSAAWLRGRIDELRLDFDYTIFQAPPAGRCSDAPLLGHLCDGVVLVLTANSTRRIAARKVKDRLFSANARLLGTVLNGRRFPIPEGIYRRL